MKKRISVNMSMLETSRYIPYIYSSYTDMIGKEKHGNYS